MLLNELLKEHGKVQQLEATVAQEQKDFQSTVAQEQSVTAQEQKQIEALRAGLDKVIDTAQD